MATSLNNADLSPMKKSSIVLTCLFGLFICGCANRAPMLFKGDYQTKPIETVKSSIINAAIKNHWSICEAGPQELRADLIYKKWKIYADITYTQNHYEIRPNLKYTTLANDDGTVHRAVNNWIKRLDRQVGYYVYHAPVSKVDAPEIPKCANFDSITYDKKGFIFVPKSYVNTGFAWISKPVHLPKNTKFSYEFVDVENIPEDIVESMDVRFREELTDSHNLATASADYHIEVSLLNAKTHSKGNVTDTLFFAGSNEQLQARVVIKDKQNNAICLIDSSIRTDTSGWLGIINKATNKVTAALTEGIFETLRERVLSGAN